MSYILVYYLRLIREYEEFVLPPIVLHQGVNIG